VSEQLDFYRVDENIRLEMKQGTAKAHSSYWEFSRMYGLLCDRWFGK